MQCVFSPIAESDLEEIGDYIAGDNPSRALSFVRELRERCAQVTAMPLAAPLRPELGKDVRMVVYGHYLIFYTVHAETVRIQRILHGARAICYVFDA
jgi:toxin ParE1/3/4